MIPLTDFALFQAITDKIGSNTGVFTSETDAFRMAVAKYGALNLPLFSLYWSSTERDDTRYNFPAASQKNAQLVIKNEAEGTAVKCRLLPIIVRYDLHLWYTRELDLISAMRDLFFFSTEAGGNGVTLNFPELGFDEIGIPLTMELSLSLDKSETQEMGKYYHGTIALGAHSWFAKGLNVKLIEKIVMDLYDSSPESDEEDEAKLLLTKEIVA